MFLEWNFWFTLVTSIVAVTALFLTVYQIRISNKQHLFDRRLRAYMILNGILELYKNNCCHFMNDEDAPLFNNNFLFMWLTNNKFMEKQANAIIDPLKQPFHSDFLRKLEELQSISTEIQLIFKGKEAIACSNFIIAYKILLFNMYQYQILINKMREYSSKSTMSINQAQKSVPEEKQRAKLIASFDKMKEAYDHIQKCNAITKIKHQIELI